MILNLTQHPATPEQSSAGVIDLPPAQKLTLSAWLTVNALPTRQEIEERCADIAMLAAMAFEGHPAQAMIGGAPWMMRALEEALTDQGIKPVYAFSVRESAEQTQFDGTVIKVNVFKHVGFIPALRQ